MGATILILAVATLFGCGDNRDVVQRPGEPAVVNFDSMDPEMDAAIRRARSSFPGFVAQLPQLRDRSDYFSVKVPIDTGTSTEHIWLSSLELRDGEVAGVLANAPLDGPYKLGDKVSVPVEEISDWMAVVDNDLYGGFTVLVARSRMSPAEQEEFDRSVDFRVPASPRHF
jgi:uncharacterized protein YegJ (DUF2314 family)